MKTRFITLLLLTSLLSITAQTKIHPDSLQKKIVAHFKNHSAESQRYNGLTAYGEAKFTFDKEQIGKEIQLYADVKNSELIHYPTLEVLDLCHNLLIHSTDKGKEFLALLNHPLDKELLVPFFMEIIFAGEFGEQLMLSNLTAENINWQRDCAGYLGSFAIYESSIPMIEKTIVATKDSEVQQALIGALTFIGHPKSLPAIKKLIETTQHDETQTKGIFAYTELTGFDGIPYLEQIKPIGEQAQAEQKASLNWLRTATNAQNKFGVVVQNDVNFIMRFKDIRAPAMLWLEKEGLLDTAKALHPVPLTSAKKIELIPLLIESKGFGLEAVKGQLFLSLEQTDIPALLELRKSCVYSPSSFSFGRLQTVGLFIRYLRKTRN